MARALMYLLGAVGTAVVASVVIPGGPLEHERALPILAAIVYAAAIGVLVGFDKMPRWGFQVLLLAVTALICWAVYRSAESGSPYKVFYFWVAIYSAFFMTPRMTAVQIGAMLAGYGGVLIALGGKAESAALQWALTASALILIGVAIQALVSHVRRLVERLTEIGRTDSLTGLYDATAFTEMFAIEIERARRSGSRLGLVIAELDDFSPVGTDRMPSSHERALAAVGDLFRSTPRQIDMAARLGGGRFGLLLPYTDEHGAYLLSERLRSRVDVLEAPWGGRVTMSFGIAGFPRAGAAAPIVFQAAESALQEAVASGGDRVMMFQRSSSAARVEIDVPSGAPSPEELLG
ncbi:MAG: GGDEF domain-containing protein [Thermoleophilaceae bacterium]